MLVGCIQAQHLKQPRPERAEPVEVGETVQNDSIRTSMGLGASPPYGAIFLFDGSKGKSAADAELHSKWQDWPRFSPGPIKFRIVRDPEFPHDTNHVALQSCCETKWGYDDIQAKAGIFKDAWIHVEFNVLGQYDRPYDLDPPQPDANASNSVGAPGYGNSGVYIASRYELQIQSWSLASDSIPGRHDMGAIVDDYPPLSNQNRANGVWQAYDILYRDARFTKGKMTTKPRMSVWWNGVQVHGNRVLHAAASGLANHSGEESEDSRVYGLKLQSEGLDIRFRNIWIKNLSLDSTGTDLDH